MILLTLGITTTILFSNDMKIIEHNNHRDTKEVEIKDKIGTTCKVILTAPQNIVSTNCKRLTNSKGIKILCTSRNKICKTEEEIFHFIKNYNPNSVKKHKSLRQGMPYSEARELILDSGWQGKNQRWQDIPQSGEINEIYYDNGWREIEDCSGTGMAYCRFEFTNIKNETLVVITEGECIKTSSIKCEKYVANWSIE